MIPATRVACPGSLDGPESAGGKELKKAMAFYAKPANRGKNYKFKAYKRPDVITALQSMFGEKCAYCESDYGAVSPADIEHYRPKGAVVLADKQVLERGYYWLAAEWSNLLPSCIDCNRERGHDYDAGREVTGKANWFPLVDESQRAQAPGDEGREKPLLLDPTEDDPDEHLEFIEKGVIMAAQPNGGDESRKGKQTIATLGLGRPGLSRVRGGHLLHVNGIVKRYRRALARVDRDPADSSARSDLKLEIEELRRLIKSSSPYAAMARQRIRPILEEAGISL